MNSADSKSGQSSSQSYGKAAVKSSIWSFLGSISKQISQFLVSLVLARFLSPESFGLIGMVTLATGFALAISEMGLGSAIIQKQNATELDIHSLFWFNLALGTSLAVVLTLMSPLIAIFFHKPELTPLVIGSSPVLLFGAASVIPAALMRKALRFQTLTQIEIFCSVFSGAAAIAMAIMGMGVWSLVAQALLLSLSNAILVTLISGYRARWMLSKVSVQSFLPFSLNLLGFNLVNYLSRNVDYLLIGKYLGASPLGLYTLAYKIMLLPLQNISWAISNALFPVFSRFSDDPMRMTRNYIRVLLFISSITFPGMAIVHLHSNEIIELFFNYSWWPAGQVLKVLALCGMLQSILAPCGIIFLSSGRTDLQLRIGLIGVAGTCFSTAIGLQWGIIGVAVGYTTFNLIWYFVINNILSKFLGCSTIDLLKVFLKGLLGFFIVYIFHVVFKYFFHESRVLNITLTASVAFLTSIGMLFRCDIIKIHKRSLIFNIQKTS